jgi:hypothetical protein
MKDTSDEHRTEWFRGPPRGAERLRMAFEGGNRLVPAIARLEALCRLKPAWACTWL